MTGVVRTVTGRAGLIGMVLGVCLAAAVASRSIADAQVVEAKFELFVTDVAASVRFYGVMGFELAHAKADGYSTLQSGATVVALSPLPWWLPLRVVGLLRRPPIGTELVFYTAHLEEMRQRLIAAGYAPGEIQLQPWGDRDFRLTDPDGYYVRLSEGGAVPKSG